MKIGFDISQTGDGKAGCGYFADSLIRALAQLDHGNEYLLYPYFGNTFWDANAEEYTTSISQQNVSRRIIENDFNRSKAFWNNFPVNGEERLGRPDIIHANNFYCPSNIQRARIVYTLYDTSFTVYPEFTTEQNRLICFDGVFNASFYADSIIAISEYSAKSFLEMFPHYPADRIRVVHLGSRFSSISENQIDSPVTEVMPDSFFLCVGTLEPRKNVRRLLKAYTCFNQQFPESLPLILAGGKGWLEDGLEDMIHELGIRNKVRILGYVEDTQLLWLYRNCFAFIYPSLFEGFGLPVLEALSQGAAVITSNTTSLPEVAGDAACYVNPTQERDLIDAMSRLINDQDYRLKLKKLSRSRAHKFSWNICASEVLDVYKEANRLPKLSFAKENK